ncbi:MAG: ABC transporter permease [Promethearchaeota archaeon]
MARFSVWFVWKKGYKTMIKNKSKIIPILILLVFSIAFGTLMFNMQDFRSKMIEEIKDYTNVPDATAYFEPITEALAEKSIENITDDLDDYEMRMVIQIKFEVFGEKYDGLLIGIDTSKKEHMHALIDENKEELDDYEFALNWGFAHRVGLEEGDKMSLSYGSVKKDIKVKVIGYNAEFQFSPLFSNVAFPSMRAFPILYVDIDYLNEKFLNQNMTLVNQLLYQVEDGSDEEDVKDEIQDALDIYSVEVVPLEEQAFFKSMREDEESDRQMLLFMTVLLLAGAVITLILVMNKLVEEDLKSISVFQALGANKREVTSSYLVFNILILSLALILGVILSNLLAIPFTGYMSKVFGIGFMPDFGFHIINAVWIGLSLFIVSIISTLLVVKKTFKMDVQQSLKYETKFLEKTNVIEKLYVKINKHSHPFTKYNLRRIFGRKLHLLSLLISLSFSGSFLIFFFGIDDGMSYSLERKFDEIEQWDCVASTWRYEGESNISDTLNLISEIDEYEFAIFDVVLFSKKDSDFDDYLRLTAFEEKSEMHLIEVEEGHELKERNDALVTRDVLNEFDLRIGDKIYIKGTASNKPIKTEIVGVVNDIASMSIILSIKDAQDALNKSDRINTIFINAKDNIEECVKQIQDLEEIEMVTPLNTLKEEIDFILDYISAAMLVFGAILMAFGVVLIVVVFKSIVDYRMEDYSNMKAVGILDKEIRKSLFAELLFYFAVSLVLGLILGLLFLSYMFVQWETEMPGLEFYIYPISYVYYTVIFSGILVFSYYINFRRVKKINIAEMMRAKTFG